MRLILRVTEMGRDIGAERRAQQRAPVVPALLVHGQRHDAEAGELVAEPEIVNDARGVRRHVDAGADLAQRPRLLIDLHVEAGAQQMKRRRHAADAAADHGDRFVGHAPASPPHQAWLS